MSLMSIPKMVVSSREGWSELERFHPAIFKVFALLVLPLSLLPPAMLYYAGNEYGDSFIAGFGAKPWDVVASVFFCGEMATFFFMGWFIKSVAQSERSKIDMHDAYMVAAIAPVPMWLSALGLFVPSLAFNAVVSLVALGMSCGLIYHGIYALCHMEEEVTAAGVTHVVMASGLIAWMLLLVSIFLF